MMNQIIDHSSALKECLNSIIEEKADILVIYRSADIKMRNNFNQIFDEVLCENGSSLLNLLNTSIIKGVESNSEYFKDNFPKSSSISEYSSNTLIVDFTSPINTDCEILISFDLKNESNFRGLPKIYPRAGLSKFSYVIAISNEKIENVADIDQIFVYPLGGKKTLYEYLKPKTFFFTRIERSQNE